MANANFNYKLIDADGSKIEDKDMLEMIEYFKKQIDILEYENTEKENIKFTVPPYPKYLPRKI